MKVFRSIGLALAAAVLALSAGCTRIETGEVGIRQNLDKTISTTELQPGSWNQTLIGDVLTFPVKDITVSLENKQPLTADNTALSDFDLTVVYNLNPSAVGELYTTKSRAFHSVAGGDIFLMHQYMETLVNNATYKAIRGYNALDVADKRVDIEKSIRDSVQEQLKAEKLDTSLHVSVVQVRSILPNKQILDAATNYVRAQNDLKVKQTEVEIAKKESERMAALAFNSEKSVAFMDAQARLNISEGVKTGKVQTVVIPADFKGFVNVGK
jgi:regulator of protease activity HflC (stomatin/prohibitin superfamily)